MKQTKFVIMGLLVLVALLGLNTHAYGVNSCTRWYVEKTAESGGVPITSLTLAPGQIATVNYKIKVDLLLGDPCTVNELLEIDDSYFVTDQQPKGWVASILYVNDEQYYGLGGSNNLPGYWPLPKVFSYQRTISYPVCGDYTVDNMAKICNGKTDGVTLSVHVPCGGCTLTPGYWKTHSMHGPAPYDDTWALVGDNGADEFFFGTGQTWLQVLWTPPKRGNAYYILAHAYIAAKLNTLNEAGDAPGLAGWLADAEFLLDQYDGDGASEPVIPKTSADRSRALELATFLDNYNNGLVGPGHCSE